MALPTTPQPEQQPSSNPPVTQKEELLDSQQRKPGGLPVVPVVAGTELPSTSAGLPSAPAGLPSSPAPEATPTTPQQTTQVATPAPQKVSLSDIREAERIRAADRESEEDEAKRKALAALNQIKGGDITAQDLINGSKKQYAYLNDKVVQYRQLLMDNFSNNNAMNQRIADARIQRGQKYNEVYSELSNMLTAQLVSDTALKPQDTKNLITLVLNEMLGLGPIEPLWLDPSVSEIMVNGPHDVKVEIKGKLVNAPAAQFRDANHLLDVCQQILAPINRSVDVSNPLEDGSLVDGSRVNVVHPVIASDGPYLTIRRFPDTAFTLKDLVGFGAMNEAMATDLGNWVHHGLSTVIAGGTSTGKTSNLNALSGVVPNDERVIAIEDTRELRLNSKKHVLYHQARKASTTSGDTKGEISIRDLVKNALRQRPDRIIVGEVRDATAYDMIQALNTGHDGSLTTTHANDAHGTIDRLASLMGMSGEVASDAKAMGLLASAIRLLVIIERFEDGSRRIVNISEVPTRPVLEDGISKLEPVTLWEFVQSGYDENDRVVGDWVKKNDMSEASIRKHRLDYKPRLSLEELYNLS